MMAMGFRDQGCALDLDWMTGFLPSSVCRQAEHVEGASF